MDHGALVLFSGGQDSTACLAWALERYPRVETVGFAYGQRHAVELDVRAPIRDALARHPARQSTWAPRLGPDHLVDLAPTIAALGASALTSDAAIALGAHGLPTTFVPGRNLLFLTCAAALAVRRGLTRIVAGMCETDYSGYPDCRDDTVKAMQLALNLGLAARLVLETPLMWLDKAATWSLAADLDILDLTIDLTHTCYRGDRLHKHPWGYGCATCPACTLRAQGWHHFHQSNPHPTPTP